jgi:hypothetical protein
MGADIARASGFVRVPNMAASNASIRLVKQPLAQLCYAGYELLYPKLSVVKIQIHFYDILVFQHSHSMVKSFMLVAIACATHDPLLRYIRTLPLD